MNILWTALAICLIVSFVFYVFAVSWQRTLRGHSRAIHILYQRLESLESMEAPFLRQKIGELMPSQLEEVCIFNLSFSERFWRRSLEMTDEQVCDIRENAALLGSVKLDVWRRHTTITVTELLPVAKSTGWQKRTIEIYGSDNPTVTRLWELCLGPNGNSADRGGRCLQLRFRDKALELAISCSRTLTEAHGSNSLDERIFFRVPLDAEHLADYRVDDQDLREFVARETAKDRTMACFSNEDEDAGIVWHLSIRALDGGVSDKWRFMEPARARRIS
jgi:hypothetical protein